MESEHRVRSDGCHRSARSNRIPRSPSAVRKPPSASNRRPNPIGGCPRTESGWWGPTFVESNNGVSSARPCQGRVGAYQAYVVDESKSRGRAWRMQRSHSACPSQLAFPANPAYSFLNEHLSHSSESQDTWNRSDFQGFSGPMSSNANAEEAMFHGSNCCEGTGRLHFHSSPESKIEPNVPRVIIVERDRSNFAKSTVRALIEKLHAQRCEIRPPGGYRPCCCRRRDVFPE